MFAIWHNQMSRRLGTITQEASNKVILLHWGKWKEISYPLGELVMDVSCQFKHLAAGQVPCWMKKPSSLISLCYFSTDFIIVKFYQQWQNSLRARSSCLRFKMQVWRNRCDSRPFEKIRSAILGLSPRGEIDILSTWKVGWGPLAGSLKLKWCFYLEIDLESTGLSSNTQTLCHPWTTRELWFSLFKDSHPFCRVRRRRKSHRTLL